MKTRLNLFENLIGLSDVPENFPFMHGLQRFRCYRISNLCGYLVEVYACSSTITPLWSIMSLPFQQFMVPDGKIEHPLAPVIIVDNS